MRRGTRGRIARLCVVALMAIGAAGDGLFGGGALDAQGPSRTVAVPAGLSLQAWSGPATGVSDALPQDGKVNSFLRWDAEAQRYRRVLPFQFGTATLEAGEAFWVDAGEAFAWSQPLSAATNEPPAAALSAGLNLAAWWGPPLPAEELAGALPEPVTTVFLLTADGYQRWERNGPPILTTIGAIPQGAAIWLRAEADAAWERPGLPAALQFTEIAAESGLDYVQHVLRPRGPCLLQVPQPSGALRTFCEPERMSGGAAAADYDGDGWTDLFVTRLDAPDILYRNRGDGSFEDVSAAAGLTAFDLQSNGAAWGDIDNDGDPDLYVTTIGEDRFYLFINDGRGGFTEEALARGAALQDDDFHVGITPALGDFDRDGWLDLHTTEWRSDIMGEDGGPAHARLLRNRGPAAPGQFEDVTDAAGVALDNVESQTESRNTGVYAFASSFVDLDGDGWQDLAIASDFGYTRLFWNNGDGTFTDGTLAAAVGSDENGMGSTFGDYDADGDLDWFVTSIFDPADVCELQNCNWGTTGNRLYAYVGNRRFTDATDAAGVRDGGWGWGTVFFDAENDGDQDLVMTNGQSFVTVTTAYLDDPMRYWRNDGGGRLVEASEAVGLTDTGPGKGLLSFDYDRDGDLDLFIVTNGGTPLLYRNDGGNAAAWLRVRLEGMTSNREGLGARLTLRPGGGRPSQIREAGAASHFLGQSERTLHFGLGEGLGPGAELEVVWPASGRVTTLEDLPVNVTILVREDRDGFLVVE